MKRCLQFLLFKIGLFGPHRLVGMTWISLLKSRPKLRQLKKAQRRFKQSLLLNNFTAAFLIVIFVVVALILCCFIPEHFSTTRLAFISWIKFPKVENAYSLLSETLGAAATIIGLSFVVIGFIFETVKNRTLRTYRDIFRVTNLYYVFSISIVSIFALTLINTFKYSTNNWTAGNLAILGTVLLLATTLSIAHLFYKVLVFFNPQYVARLSKNALLRAAQLRLLQTWFNRESEQVFDRTMKSYGFENDAFFPGFLGEPADELLLDNEKEMQLEDVFFPLLRLTGRKIRRRCSAMNFYSLRYQGRVERRKPMFWFDAGTLVKSFERKYLSYSVLLKPIREDDFSEEKKILDKRLGKSAETGNKELLNEALEDMGQLFEIYYKYGR
ncbi:hypothetical protein VRU48_19120 [Pedobacter sp. KR3-3]|uniref:DUF2254 domain-containing protein n=1 Tax=Pedobacter albus TaxID=3113905 RepID=A0ABU7ID92_9SPHI|nr:hypothetical protein [Pedobacter sp. KR3-3]MEE1947246.1 hypothetical protein [Pedobacter sp. KR3-3]